MADRRSELAAIAATIRREDEFLLACHQNPDGDAIGSLLGTYHLLRGLGKRVTAYVPDPIAANLRFLPGCESIVTELPERHRWLVLLDCGSPERVNPAFAEALPFEHSIVLDHHLTERPFGDIACVDPEAAATGELVYRLMRTLEWEPTPEFATCIYTAIFTDTGSFHFSNTSPTALRIASEMAAAGAQPNLIAEEIFENQPAARLRLLGEVLRDLELLCEGRVAAITVRRSDLERHGATREMIEGFIDYPRSIQGVLIAVQFREVEPDRIYKVSLRSKRAVDVEAVARRFGGGGHMHAAGCTLEGPLAEVKARILPVLAEALEAAGVPVRCI